MRSTAARIITSNVMPRWPKGFGRRPLARGAKRFARAFARQDDGDARTFVWRADQGHAPAMRLGQSAYDGKTKAGPFVRQHRVMAALAEAFEDFFVIPGRD